MSLRRPDDEPSEDDFLDHVARLLADPVQQDNPLREPFAKLLERYSDQRELLERVVRISDGFDEAAHDERCTLAEQCERHVRRLEKMARISDRYQKSLMEMSEALERAAVTDPLTGLGNRRHLMERMREEAARVAREKQTAAVALLDVDHFKQFNDRYGHDAGDRLLCSIAETVRDGLRPYDVCGRWGGEEFLFVLPETTPQEAVEVCMRIHGRIREIDGREELGASVSVTASVGIAPLLPDEEFSEAIRRADDLLLRAKRTGRNRVLIAEELREQA